jgi:aryl-alcohol dehydrogenase-like predicted oxidoreductase
MKTTTLIGETVPRIGYGTMRLPGEHVWGPPKDHAEAIKVLKRVVELGVRVIDTAWYYGPDVANELVAEALFPYEKDLIFVTKLGGARDDKSNWIPAIKPDELRAGMERDLELLKIDSVPIVHLRWIEHNAPEDYEIALDTMLAMKSEGLFQHLGLSNVTEEQLDLALSKTPIATISNPYSFADRHDDAMIDRCEKEGISYLPFFPLAVGKMDDQAVLQKWAAELSATPTQIALAWLLKRSPIILPIPGTSSVAHLEENVAAGSIELPEEAFAEINTLHQKLMPKFI